MMPVIALRLIESIQFTANVINALTDKCIIGISADRARCQAMVEQSLAMVTALAPAIDYEKAAKLAQRGMASGQTIRELAQQEKVLGDDELAKILDPWRMTQPGIEISQRARAKRQVILSLSTYSSGQGTIGKNLHVSKMLTKSLLKHLFNNMSSLLKQRVTTIFRLGTWLDTT
jgi:hypothetical protein